MTDWEQAARAAVTLAAAGDRAGAQKRLANFPAKLKTELEREPDDERRWVCLARMEMLLGHRDEALRCARKAIELIPEARDAADGPFYSLILAMVQA